jgi:mannose-6-phosphate isomerase-like protein (cupin superfamily)
MVQKIYHKGVLLSIIIRAGYEKNGIEFFTPDDFSQQLAYMKRPKDYVIPPHVHSVVKREVQFTKEVLIIRKGKVRVDFYDDEKNYLQSSVVGAGDVILLAHGGHGFEMMEESEIIEIKQGPYVGESDKIRFEPVGKKEIKMRDENG